MLAWILAVGPSFMKPEFWLEKAGKSAPWVITAIIFAETGLFFGFFLPGDSLLFLSGFMTSSGAEEFTRVGAAGEALRPVYEGMPHIGLLLPILFLAAVAGDQVGYLIGRKAGEALYAFALDSLRRSAETSNLLTDLRMRDASEVSLALHRDIAPLLLAKHLAVSGAEWDTEALYRRLTRARWATSWSAGASGPRTRWPRALKPWAAASTSWVR